MIDETAFVLLIVFICAYFIGSVAFGVIASRIYKLGDLRNAGSGNIGATNVLRTGSKSAALFTLLGDGAKGAVVVLIVGFLIGAQAAKIAALGVLIGHCYSLFLAFNGGKGVATFIGIMLALDFKTGLCACLTWLVIAGLFRISSLSAIVTAAMVPLWLLIFGRYDLIFLSIVLAGFLWFRHRANIQRLLQNEEPKIKL